MENKGFTIECDNIANIDSKYYSNQLKCEIINPHMAFLGEVSLTDIVENCSSLQGLFDELMEHEDVKEMLHEYLEKAGYNFIEGGM